MASAAASPNSNWNDRYEAIDNLLNRSGPFQTEFFEPDPANLEVLTDMAKVLVVGAGGLGCELLKDLALVGFRNIAVIDMDTIDLSNLNRQFLFRKADIGKSKAEVAAAFIMKRVPGVKVTAFNRRLETFDSDFYRQFHVIVLGLDSLSAREWINRKIHQLVRVNENGVVDEETAIPIIDGGTEGFRGSAQVMTPGKTHCFQCMKDLFPPTNAVQLCTLATKPRTPAHCVLWAQLVHWPDVKPFGDAGVDGDDYKHIQWIVDRGIERGNEFGIQGIDFRMAQGVVKNIIPAVASTNAVIAAMCSQEAFKVVTGAYSSLNTNMMFTGDDGLYMHTYETAKLSSCDVCNNLPILVQISSNSTLAELRKRLADDEKTKFEDPQLISEGKHLYYNMGHMQKGAANLDKPLSELVKSPAIIEVYTNHETKCIRVEFI